MQLFILLGEGKCIYHCYHADQIRDWNNTKSGKPEGIAAFFSW